MTIIGCAGSNPALGTRRRLRGNRQRQGDVNKQGIGESQEVSDAVVPFVCRVECGTAARAVSSVEERLLHTQEVAGSSPAPPTIDVNVGGSDKQGPFERE